MELEQKPHYEESGKIAVGISQMNGLALCHLSSIA
jgi:hypothetical protein